MAIQKNFVVKNGIEVNDNLIFADKDRNTVGIGTTLTPEKLQVNGGIGATSLVVTGVGTIPTLRSTDAFVSNGYINVGLVTSISGAGLTYTTGNFGIVNANNANAISGVVTNLSGTISTYTNSYSTVLNSGTVLTPNLYAVSGIVTNGTVTNLTGTAATIGTVQIVAGIVTATSGVVTYYGDGQYLNLTSNAIKGIGIGTTGGVVGYGITFLDLKGAGVSTSIYNSSVGIATIFFQGGGGGGGGAIGIGSTFPGTPLSLLSAPSNGDLFYHIDYGRTFIYYDEVILGVGSSAFWVDAAPFNVGVNPTLAGVAFSMGTASNPSAYFEGYTNTGWFSPTAGQFGIVSVGNTILTANPSGIVVTGIASATGFAGTFSGTSAVFSNGSSGNIVRITQTGTGNALLVEDEANPDTTPFVVTGIGSVGVGTNAPINTLDVHGTIRAARQDAVSSGGEIVFARASDNTNAWAVDVEGSDFRVTDSSQSATRIHIDSGGNVGLGSTATSKLHVFGNASITGVTTIADVVKVGGATTSLIVQGNARITGILTVGSSSITLDGANDAIRVGSGVTISASTGLSGSGANLTALNASNISSGTLAIARLAVASQAQAEAGTDTATVMTPQRVAQALAALAGGGQVVTTTFTSSGTFTKNADDLFYFVHLIGGGAGGGGGNWTTYGARSAGCGGGGFFGIFLSSNLPTSINVTIGAGGALGQPGGNSTFYNVKATGGGMYGYNSSGGGGYVVHADRTISTQTTAITTFVGGNSSNNNSIFGGGSGSFSVGSVGGYSVFAGNGGEAQPNEQMPGASCNGSIPGGGGGSAYSDYNSSIHSAPISGGRGECRIYAIRKK